MPIPVELLKGGYHCSRNGEILYLEFGLQNGIGFLN